MNMPINIASKLARKKAKRDILAKKVAALDVEIAELENYNNV